MTEAGEPIIQVLDGGMGATLDALGYDVSGPMWGGELLSSNPEVIQRVHQGYIDAGADIIETATYQIALPPSISSEERDNRKRLMAIGFDEAIKSAHKATPKRKIALSIGPYGAILVPGQEYTGAYPPPYGVASPSSFSSSSAPSSSSPKRAITPISSAMSDSNADAGAGAAVEDALMEFHLSRLLHYSSLAQWTDLQWIAFETIPLLSEIRAIRRAMAKIPKVRTTPKWWITCPFPNGRLPNGSSPQGEVSSREDASTSVDDVLNAMLSPLSNSAVPDGIGINCTHPSYLTSLSSEFSRALRDLLRSRNVQKRPSWVMYPDGGATYDPVDKSWTERGYDAAAWADAVAMVARGMEAELDEEQGEKLWAGVVVGGCCKSSFEEIRALKSILAPPP